MLKTMWKNPEDQVFWTQNVHSSILVMLYKKGPNTDPTNYRAISLLCICSRILARVVAQRLSKWAEENDILPEYQWGFRAGRSCRDVIYATRSLLEMFARAEERLSLMLTMRRVNRKQPDLQYDDDDELRPLWENLQEQRIMLTAIDIQKAYPNTNREKLWALLTRIGVDARMVSIIRTLHADTSYVVRTDNSNSEAFKLYRGVREGCPSSPVLFNIYHTVALKAMEELMEGIFLVGTEKFYPNQRKSEQQGHHGL